MATIFDRAKDALELRVKDAVEELTTDDDPAASTADAGDGGDGGHGDGTVERKRREEMEREERKHREEIDREAAKHQREMEREAAKHDD